MSKYADIIERLEKATRANFQLERDIDAFCHFGSAGSLDRTPPPYTASIDAAIALVERMLPGWHYTLASTNTTQQDQRPWCDLASPAWVRGENDNEQAEATAPTLPLALLLTLFRALEAKDGE